MRKIFLGTIWIAIAAPAALAEDAPPATPKVRTFMQGAETAPQAPIPPAEPAVAPEAIAVKPVVKDAPQQAVRPQSEPIPDYPEPPQSKPVIAPPLEPKTETVPAAAPAAEAKPEMKIDTKSEMGMEAQPMAAPKQETKPAIMETAPMPKEELKAAPAPTPAVKTEPAPVVKETPKAEAAPAPAIKTEPTPMVKEEPKVEAKPAPTAMAEPAEPARKPLPGNQEAAPAPQAMPAKSLPKPVDAYGQIIDSEGGDAIPALPIAVQSANGLSYLSGGIGDEEMNMLRQHESEFNVRLLMASQSGEYLSEAYVRVLNAEGEPVATVAEAGPYLYMALPPGRYTFDITARQGGIKKAVVNAPEKGFTKPIVRFTE